MDDTTSKSRSADREPVNTGPRRPYNSPILTEYGSVAKLTQAMFVGSQADGGMGFAMRRVCL